MYPLFLFAGCDHCREVAMPGSTGPLSGACGSVLCRCKA
jgi:hypothetical protein